MRNIEKIFWTQELSIGNKDIDYEHNELLNIYNDLLELIELNKNREEFARILSKMTDYSLYHFKREEEYMQNFSYPKLEKHKQYHRNYIYKVAMYNVDLLNANPPEPRKIIEFLRKWWINHIQDSDTKYEDYKIKMQPDVNYR